MDLEKDSLDFGMFTNHPEAMHRFYTETLGLPFQGTVPMGPKFKLSRYTLNDSILKVWHAQDPLTPRAAAGFKTLVIADPKASSTKTLTDPDGNRLELVPSGHDQVDQIEFRIGVSDPATFERFFSATIGAQRIGNGRFRLGRTILSFSADSAAYPVKAEPLSDPMDAVAAMSGVGFRYLTLQVPDCKSEYERLMGKGINLGVALTAGGGPVVAVFMVRDPDGNWLEVLQRKQ